MFIHGQSFSSDHLNQNQMATTGELRPHFVLLPIFAQGHLIPMTDFALVLARRGENVSIITTPSNAPRIQPTLLSSDLPVNLIQFQIPTEAVGLPPGCENFDELPEGENEGGKLFLAALHLEQPLRRYLQSLHPSPTCLISDFSFPWTRNLSRELRVPRYVFYSVCCFTLYCLRVLPRCLESNGGGDSDPFLIPGIPHDIALTREQAQGWAPGSEGEALRKETDEAENSADGIIVNNFSEADRVYTERYAAEIGRPVWSVGPLVLCKGVPLVRGGHVKIEEGKINAWLDSWDAKTVVYVCLGTIARIPVEQLVEIGTGLEATGRPFVWVLRSDEKLQKAEAWLAEGFEERNKERGLVIRGWAPQTVILRHPSVGVFVTHCGWNSVVEAVAMGVPMVTWPRFSDQFLNARMVVDVLGTGVGVGGKVWENWWCYEVKELVGREEVSRAVEEVMFDGEAAEGRRRRAETLRGMARDAVGDGGSSKDNLDGFVSEFLKKFSV